MQDVTKPSFVGKEWDGLTIAERVAKCHIFAREAMLLAGAAHPDMKDIYRDIATQWNMLAAELEQSERDDQKS